MRSRTISTDHAFERANGFALRWEGGFVNHPADPDGATNKGVTQRVYDNYRADKGIAKRDVRDISDDEVHDIYRSRYWETAQCPSLLTDMDVGQFDTAVNMGVKRAIMILQSAIDCEPVDGRWGPKTNEAVQGCDHGKALKAYCDIRERRYRHLAKKKPKLQVFLKGWLNRLNDLRGFVGLPGFEAVGRVDFGDADYIYRLGEEELPGDDLL